MASISEKPQSYLSLESLKNLLLLFQQKPNCPNAEEFEHGKEDNNSQERAGMQLWDITCSLLECKSLLQLNIVQVCSEMISPSNTERHSDRIIELAAGILSNIAVHKRYRHGLKRHENVLKVSSERYLVSSDAFIMAEITRLFSVLLRSSCVNVEEEGDSIDSDHVEFTRILATGVVSKASWVIHNSLDLCLLGRTCEFLLVLSFYEPALFKCLVADEDCKLAEGVAEMAKNFLEDFQTLEQGTLQTGYVIDLLDCIIDELSSSDQCLSLCPVLPVLADCIISQSLSDSVIDKTVTLLSRLHHDVRQTVALPIEPDLASSLLQLLESPTRGCLSDVLDLLCYQLELEQRDKSKDQMISQLILKHKHKDVILKLVDAGSDVPLAIHYLVMPEICNKKQLNEVK